MTVSTTQSRVTYAGNGSTTVFPFAFPIPASGEEVVIYTSPQGAATTLAPGQYAVAGFGNANGGSVVYPLIGSPIVTGATLTVARVVPIVQGSSLTNQGPYLPSATEAALDYLTLVAQQINDALSRSLTAPLSDPIGLTLTIPTSILRAGGYLGFDSSGNVAILQGAAISTTTLNAFFAALPTTLPAPSGVVWNDNGAISIS